MSFEDDDMCHVDLSVLWYEKVTGGCHVSKKIEHHMSLDDVITILTNIENMHEVINDWNYLAQIKWVAQMFALDKGAIPFSNALVQILLSDWISIILFNEI